MALAKHEAEISLDQARTQIARDTAFRPDISRIWTEHARGPRAVNMLRLYTRVRWSHRSTSADNSATALILAQV